MKKKYLILSLSLLGLVMIYVGTYAYYLRVINGTLTGTTGAFVFNVYNNDTEFTSINLYDTMENPSVVSDKKVIVPGDSGSFKLTANGKGSDTDIEYSITFKGSEVPANMKFYLDDAKTKVMGVTTDKISGYLDISESSTKEHTIYWQWPYDSGENNNLDYEFANKEILINVKVEAKQSDGILTYGIKRDTASTSTVWERVGNSVGLVANAVMPSSEGTITPTATDGNHDVDMDVQNDFDNIYPWSDIKSYNYNAETKTITAWYGDSNFKFDGSNGEVLTYIPDFYYKREVVDGVEYQYISQYEQDGFIYSPAFSVGRYKISKVETSSNTNTNINSKSELMATEGVSPMEIVNNTTISSRSGSYPLTSYSIGYFREFASKLGSEFSQMDWHYYVLQMLYLVEYADYDVQAKLGLGVVFSEDAVEMGGTDDLGMKSGCLVNDGTGSSIYRGMEDLYSNVLEFIDGINIKDQQAYINYNFVTYWSDTFDGDYKPLGYANVNGGNGSAGFITKIGYDSNNPLIGYPIELASGREDYNVSIKDYYVANPGEVILVAGGAYGDSDHSSRAGLWAARTIVGSGNRSNFVGARLIKNQTSGGRGVTNPQIGKYNK